MLGRYPRVVPEIRFHLEPNGIVSCQLPGFGESFEISSDAWALLSQCLGELTVRDLLAHLGREWEIDTAEAIEFLRDSAAKGFLTIEDRPIPVALDVTGDGVSILPKNVSLEITSRCNLSCLYCYSNCSPSSGKEMSLEDALQVLRLLRANGVQVVQLTGGEPLIHPRFIEILGYAVQLFPLVGILSNGVAFTPQVLDLLGSHSERVAVQISVDGATERTSAVVRRRTGTFVPTLRTIRDLIERGIRTRVGYVVTPHNAAELDDTAQLLATAGVEALSIGLADEIGRAEAIVYPNPGGGGGLFQYLSARYSELIRSIALKYPDLVTNKTLPEELAERYGKRKNCGAGWRSVGIDPTGEVRPCLYLDAGRFRMGNVFTDEYRRIFNGGLANAFYQGFSFSAMDEPGCEGCEHRLFCASCMVRIAIANRNRSRCGLPVCDPAQRLGLTAQLPGDAPAGSGWA